MVFIVGDILILGISNCSNDDDDDDVMLYGCHCCYVVLCCVMLCCLWIRFDSIRFDSLLCFALFCFASLVSLPYSVLAKLDVPIYQTVYVMCICSMIIFCYPCLIASGMIMLLLFCSALKIRYSTVLYSMLNVECTAVSLCD